MDMRKAHLEALPGFQLKEDLEALQRCLHVFSRNAADLAGHVSQFLTSPQIAKEISEEYVNELVRLLHNYLTSVTSVIDSQRVVMRHRWPTKGSSPGICGECRRPLPMEENLSEFESKVYASKLAEAFETGEGVFMTKLRNYCTHYSIPVPELATTLSWGQGMPGTARVNTLQLDRDKLLRWGGWTAAGKAYLKRLFMIEGVERSAAVGL
ncbi:hypothetical protein ACJH6J_29640 [Mycobacterium sp. SMC-18]|uniref:hypothetical protein n=1 Tax=Mycobacterium sp. SMC-18 TaxID=3381629 RepID=UPI0038777CA9